MKRIVVGAFMASLALAVALPALAGAPPPPPGAQAPRQAEAGAVAQKLDLNRATREELVGVPGIGERLAESIIELRTKRGPFSTVDELLAVRGIGENSLKRLSEHLVVAAPAGASAGVAAQAR